MANESASGRWWENYLVRYFMPSIAGIGIVAWLMAVGPEDLRTTLFLGKGPASIDAPTLTLLVLYGNLFCYVASYPILCFHATRVIDFHEYKWSPCITDGHISTFLFGIGVLFSSVLLHDKTRVVVTLVLVLLFVIIQLLRIRASLQYPSISGYSKRPATLLYAFFVTLSMRRGVVSTKTTTHSPSNSTDLDAGDESSSETIEEETRWQREFIDSYRHMREHGNSAFIFALELSLAAACYGIVRLPHLDGLGVLSLLGILFTVWSIPAVFVHFLGQHLERRYSIFDRRLRP